MSDVSAISREAFTPGIGTNGRRRYHSPFRDKQVEATRLTFIEAVLRLARKGNFRADVHEICEVAGYHRRSLQHHFGAVHLLYRVVAREHWIEVVPLLPFSVETLGMSEKDAVWAVLVGRE